MCVCPSWPIKYQHVIAAVSRCLPRLATTVSRLSRACLQQHFTRWRPERQHHATRRFLSATENPSLLLWCGWYQVFKNKQRHHGSDPPQLYTAPIIRIPVKGGSWNHVETEHIGLTSTTCFSLFISAIAYIHIIRSTRDLGCKPYIANGWDGMSTFIRITNKRMRTEYYLREELGHVGTITELMSVWSVCYLPVDLIAFTGWRVWSSSAIESINRAV